MANDSPFARAPDNIEMKDEIVKEVVQRKSLIYQKEPPEQWNYAQQELKIYEESMKCYQNYNLFDYFLQGKFPEDQFRQIDIRGFTIENFI